VLGVVVEDLPQLFIQGFYLISSGDTGNLVVLVSVSVSGCSLLLRFVRGAFAFITSGESRLAETSPMREWDQGKMRAWLTRLFREDSALGVDVGCVPEVIHLTASQLLGIADAVVSAQAGLVRDADEEKEGRDEKGGVNGEVGPSTVVPTAAIGV